MRLIFALNVLVLLYDHGLQKMKKAHEIAYPMLMSSTHQFGSQTLKSRRIV